MVSKEINIVVLILLIFCTSTQPTDSSQPKAVFSKNPSALANVQKINPIIQANLVFASPQNFTGKTLYKNAQCLLHKNAAEKLDLVQKELSKQNLGLLIFDAFRPLAVQRILWEANPDERFVANPAKGGGRHTRGTAVDLTLIKLDTKEMLEMPSKVSDFSRCSRDRQDITPTARKNMLLLENIMKKHGFVPLASEWWHFDLADWQNYPAIDLDFDEIEAQKA